MRTTIGNNIKSTLPGIENQNAKDFLKLVEEKFRYANKALARTLMAELTTMKLDGLKRKIDIFKRIVLSVRLGSKRKKVLNELVFKTKHDSKGNVERYKARLVAKVAHFDLELHQMDMKTAFLNGNIEKEVYMEQSEGFFIDD
ncbi:retrovirus-related pol polyprotein from transposon TNT 1-94 [Tanacetum coccineum]